MMMNTFRHCRFLVPALGLLFFSTAFAQTKSDKPPADGVSVEIIQGRLKQIEDTHDLEESVKAKVQEYYQQAIREIDSAKTWQANRARFEQMAASAAADLAANKKRASRLAGKPALDMPEISPCRKSTS